jgi:hypothetical protein
MHDAAGSLTYPICISLQFYPRRHPSQQRRNRSYACLSLAGVVTIPAFAQCGGKISPGGCKGPTCPGGCNSSTCKVTRKCHLVLA